jgi:prevent-host-death family protein
VTPVGFLKWYYRYPGPSLAAIPVRDLRNHTAEVLRRVEAGEEIEVLRNNRPVAKIIPLSRRRQ